jgi:hypothetical protein
MAATKIDDRGYTESAARPDSDPEDERRYRESDFIHGAGKYDDEKEYAKLKEKDKDDYQLKKDVLAETKRANR